VAARPAVVGGSDHWRRDRSEIAAALFVSHGTVKTHVGRILTKLDLRDRVQAVVLSYETGLIRPGETSW
jgi:DNA-binding CsgD family transcriptional regulator